LSTLADTSVKNPIIVPLGIITAPFTDVITKGGKTWNTSEAEEIRFYLRPLLSRNPVIKGEKAKVIWPVDEQGNNVKYEWTLENVAAEGEYMAWWDILENKVHYETPEFPITISDHGPGIGVQTGGIFDGVADYMPITFSALKTDPKFGERRIQKKATLIQLRVMGSSVSPDEEITAYSLPILDYLSKRTALELCAPGIDYWARQRRTVTAQGPTEISSFPDMIKALESLRDRLIYELEQDWREIQFLVPGTVQRRAIPMPSSSTEFYECNDVHGNLIPRPEAQPYVTRDPNTVQPLITGPYAEMNNWPLGIYPSFL
jgi:hypothetical protein